MSTRKKLEAARLEVARLEEKLEAERMTPEKAIDLLEGAFTIDDGNEMGPWLRSGYERNGVTIFRADIEKTDLLEYQQAVQVLIDALNPLASERKRK